MSGGIGDYRWLNNYIGLPYAFGGRDRKGVDCYGLIRLIFENEYQIQLPDWQFDEINLKLINDEIQGQVTSGDFEEIDGPEDGCFAICVRVRAAHHMGLCFAGGVIHAQEKSGVIFQPVRVFESKFKKVIYGDWTP